MPPRRRAGEPATLTADDLATLTTALAEGRRATVYLRDGVPSLGVDPGASAKVVSIDGSTVTVSPKGVHDELPFEADELHIKRPPAPKPADAAPAPTVVHQEIEPAPAPRKAPAKPAAATPDSAPVKPAAKPAPPRSGKRKPAAGVAVTIHAGADNEWTVTVAHGAKRPGKAVPVSPDAVERAVRELGEPTAVDAVESILVAARTAAAARVEELARELEEARRALDSLGAPE
ncbi:DUF6319 family protein [Rhodococcus sp. HNM0569]|uniref:DUF6319 family protein n=1 Tax=Rhodococcus sp. HNM0569 TaxID=2716340 RepID=UPI00146A996B|nr:DUF6319 family protein [Rhodococcus sp. HNM0569]NLU83761.1 translation initiation factor [Rhodococcus sp. HNM0569]